MKGLYKYGADTRTGDRHKDTEKRRQYQREYQRNYRRDRRNVNRRRPKWGGGFIAIDGEGWDGKYTILAMSGREPLVNTEGLSTLECLNYLVNHKFSRRNAFVGFALGYDFENILRDIPDDEYMLLVEDGDNSINYHDYEIKYIPRKILEIKYHTGTLDRAGKEIIRSIFIQDVFGFFQCSFIRALEKWGINVPREIREGKAERDIFREENLEQIVAYNQIELELLVELMNRLRAADADACQLIGIQPNHTPRSWYGPGARAANFLNQTDFISEHPEFTGPVYERLKAEVPEAVAAYPFAAAFYGGRIEAAAVGLIEGELYDYDINSAYPYAITRLPKWGEGDLVRVEGFDKKNRAGMYYVEWDIKEDCNFYPFPFRSRNGNVFFPRTGSGWYMSPEVAAALDVFGDAVEVYAGYVVDGTDGAGDGLTLVPESRRCFTARLMEDMAAIRLKAKAEKRSSEKVLKLIMNSCYGKLIQQVGSRKYLNFWAGSWITSTCRAMLLRAVGKDTDNEIISMMTDGILSTKKLNVELGENLGQFSVEKCTKVYQFMPGVYCIGLEGGGVIKRYRGMSKDFDAAAAGRAFYSEIPYPIKLRVFVTRRLAIHQPNRFGHLRYKFVTVEKAERFSLKSKREDAAGRGFKLREDELFKFFPAKNLRHVRDLIFGSYPYKVSEPAILAYDTAKTLEELTDDRRIGSVIESEEMFSN